MRVLVKFYRDAPNPHGLPGNHPAELIPDTDPRFLSLVGDPVWHEMSLEEFEEIHAKTAPVVSKMKRERMEAEQKEREKKGQRSIWPLVASGFGAGMAAAAAYFL